MDNDDVVYGRGKDRQRPRGLAVLTVGISLVAACAPLSVAPIVADGQAVDVPGLAGRWVSDDDDTTTVASLGAGAYALSFTDKDERATRFEARAGQLGERVVLDVYARLEKNEAAGLTETLLGTLVPGHLLVVVELKGDSLRAAMLQEDSVKRILRSGALRTSSLELDDRLVLTAPTDSLRDFLVKCLARPGALGEWGRFARVPAAAPPAH